MLELKLLEAKLTVTEEELTLESYLRYLVDTEMIEEDSIKDTEDINIKKIIISDEYCYIIVQKENGNLEIKYEKEEDTKKQLVNSIKLNKTNLNMYLGETEQLEASVFPSNAYNQNIEWISDNTTVVTVSKDGVIKAQSTGTAKIIVKTTDGSQISESCTVTVLEKIYLVKNGVEQREFEECNIKNNIQEENYNLIETETTNERATYQLANLIQLDEYKTLKVDIEVIDFLYSTIEGRRAVFELIISNNEKPHTGSYDYGTGIISHSEYINSKARKTYEVNIEKLIGTYGLGIRKSASAGTGISYKLYNLWLEK